MIRILIITFLLPAFLLYCSGKEKKEKIRIKIATFNVHHFTKGYTAVKATISNMKPDIIALQEVLVKGGTDYSQKLAGDLKMHLASSKPYVIFSDRKWVLTFLSRYPVIKKEETRLGKYRRALKVLLNIHGRIAAFSTMHLSPFVWSSKNLLAANRKRAGDRAEELRDLIKWFQRTGKPEVVLGDFNIPEIMPGMGLLYDYGYRNIRDEIDNRVKGTYRIKEGVRKSARRHFPGFTLPEMVNLDYILISESIKSLSLYTVNSNSSDHLPLVADIELWKADSK
jgi:endonuclease/exonuclease/phosphatase family metal-dependent hydrolase